MEVIRTAVNRLLPRSRNKSKKKLENNFKNEFYIASNEFSKNKLISFYGIEDCAITTGHGSCLKLENIFGASTISRGSISSLASSSTSISPSTDSIDEIKKNNKLSRMNRKYGSYGYIRDSQTNIAIDNTINELKLKLQKKNSGLKTSNDTIHDDERESNIETNLLNDLTSSDTIYRQSLEIDRYYQENGENENEDSSDSPNLDYISNNPEVVIDINTLKTKNDLTSCLNKSNSSVQINNINIHDAEEIQKDVVPKNEITIDVDTATKIATITNETVEEQNKEEEEENRRFVNDLYTKKFEELNSNLYLDFYPDKVGGHSDDVKISINDTFKSEDSLNVNSLNQASKKTSVSIGYLNSIKNPNSYSKKLYNTGNNTNTRGLFEDFSFLTKLGDRYNPQQRLNVSFNHLYNPLFVSNNLSKRFDVELKHVDLTIKDIYDHGLPYLLRSKRPLIEFCKELVKECQLEILFFINDVCEFQKRLFIKQSDIMTYGKEIYYKYLSRNAICPLNVDQSLKVQCVRDLKILKKECFHAIAIYFYKNLDFIFEEFKTFVLKEHYDNKTDFDSVLVTQKTDEEKKEIEDELIKLVEIYYKSSDESLTNKQQFIIKRIKLLCNDLLY